MAYSFYRTVTIDHAKCGASNSTDFPVLVSGTYTYLKTVANGGNVTNANGYDIAFYSDSAGTSILNFELVFYDATTGTVEFWVKVPTVSFSVDTVIYLFYANALISTYQGNTNGTWNSNYLMVMHCPNGSSLTVTDSTVSGYNGTVVGGVVAGAGQIDGGADFNGSTGYITVNSLSTGGVTDGTMSCWIKPDTGVGMIMFSKQGGNNFYLYKHTDNTIRMVCTTFGSQVVTSTTITTGAWSYIVGRAAAATYKIYINGAEASYSNSGSGGQMDNITGFNLGAYNDLSLKIDGVAEEFRMSNSARSADWILSEYNNQFSPSTFYAVGTAVPIGGGGGVSGSTSSRVIGFLNSTRVH